MTGQPVAIKDNDQVHMVESLTQMLEIGEMISVVEQSLQGYNVFHTN